MLKRFTNILAAVMVLFLFLGTQVVNSLHVWEEAHQHEQSDSVPEDCDLCDVIQNYQQESYDLGSALTVPAPVLLACLDKHIDANNRYSSRPAAHPTNKAPPVLG